MKNWQTWLILLLTLIVILGIVFWPKPQPSEVILNANDSIERTNQENRILKMSVRTLELTIQDTNVKKKADSARFVKEITVKNQQLAKKRVQIDTVFKDSPVLQSYLQTADSVFAMMRTRIDTLERNLKFRDGLYNDLVYMKAKQITNLEMIVGQQGVIIKDLEKQARKKRRGNKLWKAAAVTLGVAGVVVGSQL